MNEIDVVITCLKDDAEYVERIAACYLAIMKFDGCFTYKTNDYVFSNNTKLTFTLKGFNLDYLYDIGLKLKNFCDSIYL